MAKKRKKKQQQAKAKQRDAGSGMETLVEGLAPLRSLVRAGASIPVTSDQAAFADGYDRGFRAGLNAAIGVAAESLSGLRSALDRPDLGTESGLRKSP